MKRSNLTPWVAGLLFWLVSVSGARGQGTSIPPGTDIKVRLGERLETGQTQPGAAFSATVAEPMVIGGKTVLSQGAAVKGRVTEAVSSGRLKGRASFTLELTQVGRNLVHTDPLRIDGKSHLLRDAGLIGGGAAAGAIIGGVAGGKKGAAIGAAVGAGAGTVTAYLTGKQEIVLPEELPLTFVTAATQGGAQAMSTSRGQTEASTSGQALKGHQRGMVGTEEREGEGVSEVREGATPFKFSPHDQGVISNYFRVNTENLPPGLAKRGGNLPPGLERQLQRNGTLPPGLQKRVEPFPRELSQKLPRLPAGYSRVLLGNRALILDSANKILDLFLVRP